MNALDIQHGGGHYKDLKIQPVQFIHANMMGYSEGAVVKYCTRWQDKGGIQDLHKARHFIQLIQEDAGYVSMLNKLRGVCLAGAWWRDQITPETYVRENGIGRMEANVIRAITNWSNTGRMALLHEAQAWMEELIGAAMSAGIQAALIDYKAHHDQAGEYLEPTTRQLAGCLGQLCGWMLGNDQDDGFLGKSKTQPLMGTVQHNPDGSLTWHPDPDLGVTDTDQYELNRRGGHYALGTWTNANS